MTTTDTNTTNNNETDTKEYNKQAIIFWSILIGILLIIYIALEIQIRINTKNTNTPVRDDVTVATISAHATDEYKYDNFHDLDKSIQYAIPEDASGFNKFDMYLYKLYLKYAFRNQDLDKQSPVSLEELYNATIYNKFYSCNIMYKTWRDTASNQDATYKEFKSSQQK